MRFIIPNATELFSSFPFNKYSVQFLEDVRHVMGIPEWMLSVDSRKITLLHNGACIQMLIHFKGPLAHQMEQDLSRLIAGARLETPTLNIVGYSVAKRRKMLKYRVCGVREPNEKNGNDERKAKQFINFMAVFFF